MTSIIQVTDAAVGGEVMGGETMLATTSQTFTEQTGEVSGLWRTQAGWGYFGERVYGRSGTYAEPPQSAVGGGGYASIIMSSSSGGVLGRIRSDIQNTILKELSFTIDEKGCADFTMKLNSLPAFSLTAIAQISIEIGNSNFNWYTGQIEQSPEEGTFRDEYIYKGFGNRKQLSKMSVELTYTPQDVGLIVEDLVQNYIAVDTKISYNIAKIQTATGVSTTANIELSKAKMEDTLDSLAKMANCRWGVDGDGDFYFELRSTTILKNWFVGYDLLAFNPETNINDIKNRIIVSRQYAEGSGKTGKEIVSTKNDLTSQAKYQIKELKYTMPGYYSTAECDTVADQLLSDLKDPVYYAKVKDVPVTNDDSYVVRGIHRFINMPSQFGAVIQDCEDYTDWTLSGSGDLAISNSTTILTSGAASMLLSWSSANADIITAPFLVEGGIKKLNFSIRANRVGQLLTVGIGDGSYLQNTKAITINLTTTWINFEWDVSALSLTSLNEIGFVVDNSDSTTSVWIDNIVIELTGSKHYSMEMTSTSYMFTPDVQAVQKLEFGPPPKQLFDYVSEVMATAEQNKYVTEER